MTDPGLTYLAPEARARVDIDQMLEAANWTVQDYSRANLAASRGVAVREFILTPPHGRADYLLFVDRKAVGVLEAKKEGETLTGVAWQTANVEEERRVFYVGLTRARRAALITIDDRRRRVHLFIRETIRLAEPGERDRLHSQVRDFRKQEQELVIERERAEAAVASVYSGEEARTLEGLVESHRAQQAAENQSLAELEEWLGDAGARGVWRRITRKRRVVVGSASSVREALEQTGATIDQAERRLLLLRGDPDLAASPAREEAEAAKAELLQLRREAEAVRGRLFELDLLEADFDASLVRATPALSECGWRSDGKA